MSDRPVTTVTPALPKVLDDVSDAWLVEACRQDALHGKQSSRAFRELARRYGRLVYHFVYQMTQDASLTEEVTQDTFVKVHQNLHRFDSAKPFKPWLMRIASNTCISALRKEKNNVVSMDVLAEQGFQLSEAQTVESTMVTETTDPLEMAENQNQQAQLVKKALAALDEKYRQVLTLRYLQDFSYEDISNSLGIPLNTVRTWLRRGLEQFKKEIGSQQTALEGV